MAEYEVFATRWDDPHIIEELIPARGLEFSMPINDHGTANFTATVEPGKSFWRPSIAPLVSGLLIASDGVPVWSGWVIGERETGPRTFTFDAIEWGGFFERIPAVARTFTAEDDFVIFRALIQDAVAAATGQDPQIVLDTSTSSTHRSDLTVNSWDNRSVHSAFHELSERGGPDWYFGAAGTLADPARRLVIADHLGQTTAQTVLEFVEDSEDYTPPEGPPGIALLGDLYGVGPAPVVAASRRGGNVIAKARTRTTSASATQVVATGAGTEDAQITSTQAAESLISAGWPRLTTFASNSDISVQASLDEWAAQELAAARGIATGYSLVTLDGDPVWTQVPRGSQLRVILDTDVYGAERPVGGDQGFETRLLSTTVRVPDEGPAQVQWDVATVLEDL